MPSPEKKSLFTTFTTVMFSACNSVFIEVRMYLRVLNYTNTRGCFHIHMGIDSGFAYSIFLPDISIIFHFLISAYVQLSGEYSPYAKSISDSSAACSCRAGEST